MVCYLRILSNLHLTFLNQVFSSVIAAWADIGDALAAGDPVVIEGSSWGLANMTGVVSKLNVGYFWMLLNCLTSAAYVSISFFVAQTFIDLNMQSIEQVLAMRKRIKVTGFSDWDSMFYNNLLSIPVLATFSLIVEDWSHTNLQHNL